MEQDKETGVQHGNEETLTQFKFTGKKALFYQINWSKKPKTKKKKGHMTKSLNCR